MLNFHGPFAACVLMLAAPAFAAEPAAAEDATPQAAGRPNVLLIYVDDLRPQTADYGRTRRWSRRTLHAIRRRRGAVRERLLSGAHLRGQPGQS